MPLSNKQMEYLALAWQCFDTEPKIDYEKFKTVAGLASAASARELMRVTKNKLKEEYGALGAAVASSNAKTSPAKKTPKAAVSTPRSGAKRARSAQATRMAEDEANEDDDEEHTPATKKVKTSSAAKASAGKENGHIKAEPRAEDDDDFIFT